MRNKNSYQFSFITSFNGVDDITIQVNDYRPYRPAPPCSNPDSPRFSDCGDDAEWSDVKAFVNGNPVDDSLLDTICADDRIIDLIIENGELEHAKQEELQYREWEEAQERKHERKRRDERYNEY